MRIESVVLAIFYTLSCALSQELWNDKNFDSNLEASGTAFVKFFAPWCGHCKKLAPVWSDLAGMSSLKTKVVKVDCTADGKEICQRFEVKGYPTIKFVSMGGDGKPQVSDYDGDRSLDALVSYVEAKTLPAYELINAENIQKYLVPEKKPTLVAFADGEESNFVVKIKKMSSNLRDLVTVAYTTDASLAKAHSHSVGTLVLFREKIMSTKLESSSVVIPIDGDIFASVKKNVHGKVGFRRPSNQKSFDRPLLTVYSDLNIQMDPSRFRMIRNRMIKLAENTELQMAIAQKTDFQAEISELPVYSSPLIVLVQRQDGKRYLLEKSFSFEKLTEFVESTKQFLEDYKNSKLQIFIKSAERPTSDDGPVKVVVGTTFEEIVMDESKDVLIEMYAPWCGHCKSLEPKYKELAEKLKGNTNIVIAKMDSTANDSPPEYPVQGFPTIFFAPKGRKSNPIKYDGEREVDGFIKWLEKHATSKPVIVDAKKDEL